MSLITPEQEATIAALKAMTPYERLQNAATHAAVVTDFETGLTFKNYQEYLDSDTWKAKAARIKEERGGFCQIDRSRVNLNVHHNTYANVGRERDEDLIVLCHGCHELFHTHGKLVK